MCASMVGPHPEVLPPQPSCFQLRCAEHAGLLQNHAARGQYVCKWASAVEVCAHHLLLPPYIHITWYKVGTWKSWKEWASDRNELFQEQGRTSPCLFAFILCIRAFPDIYRLILLAKYTFTAQNKHIWWWMLFRRHMHWPDNNNNLMLLWFSSWAIIQISFCSELNIRLLRSRKPDAQAAFLESFPLSCTDRIPQLSCS